MKRAVIFDLDQTMVNTSALEQYRRAGGWNTAYTLIPSLAKTEEIEDLLKILYEHDIKVIINTMSPKTYCQKVINHFGWGIYGSICYHDICPDIKPHPASFLKAIKEFELDISSIISAGDSASDILASNAAKTPSIACSWDSKDINALLDANPTYHAETPLALKNIVLRFFSIVQ